MSAGFQYEPAAAIAHLHASDPIMSALISRVGPFKLELVRTSSLFDALLRSIIYQQLHGKAAATIHARVLTALNPSGSATPEGLAGIADVVLKNAGLSRAKLLAVRDLAAKCIEGCVPTLHQARRLSDEQLEQCLTLVRGIGPWTVHMLLIFHLGRADVMPTGDYAIRHAFKRLYGRRTDPSPATILRQARCWRPYRSVASWYLWRSLDSS